MVTSILISLKTITYKLLISINPVSLRSYPGKRKWMWADTKSASCVFPRRSSSPLSRCQIGAFQQDYQGVSDTGSLSLCITLGNQISFFLLLLIKIYRFWLLNVIRFPYLAYTLLWVTDYCWKPNKTWSSIRSSL